MQKKREVGIDIIKILACMFVSGLHFFVNYGFTDKQLSHPIAILQIALRWIFFTCIALFILATGYLQCSKKPEKKYYQTLGKHLAYFFVYACLTAVVINGTENLVRDSLYYFLQYPSSVSGRFYTRFDLAVGTGGGNCGNERAPSAVS